MTSDLRESGFFSNEDLDRITDNYLAPILDHILERHKITNVLDCGCGNGLFGAYLKDRAGCTLIGVDGSPYGLDQARRRGYDRTHSVEDLSREPLPLDDASVDFVLSKDVLEHLLDPLFAVREIRRVLASGGLFLLHVPNHFPIKYRLKFLFTNDLDTQTYFPDAEDWNFPHIRFFRHENMVRKLRGMGFDLVHDYSDFFTAYIPLTARIPLLAGFQRYLARRSPSHFSTGFTLLLRRAAG